MRNKQLLLNKHLQISGYPSRKRKRRRRKKKTGEERERRRRKNKKKKKEQEEEKEAAAAEENILATYFNRWRNFPVHLGKKTKQALLNHQR